MLLLTLHVLIPTLATIGTATSHYEPSQGRADNDRFGWYTSAAGDVDGDGRADVMVGDWVEPGGSVWVVSGRNGRVLRHYSAAVSGEKSTRRIYRFELLPDVDEDGVRDHYLRFLDRSRKTSGAFVHSGKDGERIVEYESQDQNVWGSGTYVADFALLEDSNGDGFPEVVRGDPHFRGDSSEAVGRLIIESGRNGQTLYDVRPPAGHTHFGYRVAITDDLDGDGLVDIRASTTHASDPPPAHPASRRRQRWTEVSTQERALFDGFAPSGLQVGDLDGDGRSEFLRKPEGETYHGVFTREGAELFPVAIRYATRACSTGDLNGDGKRDFAVSCRSDHMGSAYFVCGRTGTVLASFVGEFLVDRYLGQSLANTGDVDGDGLDDIITGGVYSLCCDNGRARVLSSSDGGSRYFLTKADVKSGGVGNRPVRQER